MPRGQHLIGNPPRTAFQEGNLAAVTHGVQSERIVALNTSVVAEEIRQALAETVPHLTEPDMLIVERLARVVAQQRMLDAYIDRLGGSPIDSRGRVRPAMRIAGSLSRQFVELCRILGLGPAVRAELLAALGAGQRDSLAAQLASARAK